MRRTIEILVLLAALGAPPGMAQEDPAALVVAGGQALVEGNLEEAERLFESARQLDAEQAVSWLGLAEVRERQNRLDEALALAPDVAGVE